MTKPNWLYHFAVNFAVNFDMATKSAIVAPGPHLLIHRMFTPMFVPLRKTRPKVHRMHVLLNRLSIRMKQIYLRQRILNFQSSHTLPVGGTAAVTQDYFESLTRYHRTALILHYVNMLSRLRGVEGFEVRSKIFGQISTWQQHQSPYESILGGLHRHLDS
jgi:hypothetical protein